MKNIFKTIVLLMIFLTLSTSCEEDFLDVNDDPNNPSSSTPQLTLAAGQASAAFIFGGQWQILGSLWSQHWTQSVGANQYAGIDNYNINENSYNTQYSNLYAESLNDLKFVGEVALENEDLNYYLISELMSVYIWQVLVDFYNQVPYFDALKGTEVSTPAFDDGQAIYDDLILRIDAALALDRSGNQVNAVGSEDLIFSGDMSQWVRFGNTLKLKILMRQSEARGNVAQSGIQALFNSGAQFLDASAEVTAFVDVLNQRNPFYATQVSTDAGGRGYVDIAASNTLLNYLLDNTDPRATSIYNPSVNGSNLVGLDQGDFTNQNFQTAKDLAQPNISATQPVVFFTAAESYFLQAEAVERYGVAGNAESLYQQGVNASFAKLGNDVSDAAALYAAGGPYEYSGIESIILQKWVSAANNNAIESHFEFLRTGIPSFFTETPNNVTGGIFPKRLPYPSTEQDNNRANYNAIGGQKQVTERVWWDTAN